MTGINADDDYDKLTFLSPLFLLIIITVKTKPAIRRQVSSFIPSETAALNPMIDHMAGIMTTIRGILDEENNNMPKEKMVVGQGNPNVGDEG